MADDRCLNADILTTTLLANNEGFARRMVELAQEKNALLTLGKESDRTRNIAKQIDMQIQAMVEARILYGEAGDAAKQTLLKRIKRRGGTIGAGIRALEMIDSISVKDLDSYAELLGKARGDIKNTQQAIDDLKMAVSNFIAAKEGLKVNYGAKVFNKDLPESERKKALGQWYKSETKKVLDGGTPTAIVSPDEQWKHIERATGPKQKKREELFNNWVLGRIFLGEDEGSVKDFINVAKKFHNTLPKLTVSKVNKYNRINTLINRVYTNAKDIAESPELRKAIKAKLIQLMSGNGDIPLTLVNDSMRIANIVQLADAGTAFTTVLKYDNVGQAVRSVLIDSAGKTRVGGDLSSQDLYNELRKLLSKKNLKGELYGKGGVKKIKAFGTEIDGEELLKIIYAASWDSEVKNAIEMHSSISDELIIDFAKAKLFGIDVKNGEKNLRDLLEKFSKPYNPDEISTIAFVATSGVPVKPTDNNKIAFVYFDDVNNLTLEDDALMTRARFNDDLAGVNTLTVTTNNIKTYNISNGVDSVPTDLEYIVIPNANVSNSRRVAELRNRLEKQGKNNKYIVVYPRSRQSGQYFVDIDGKLKFKTTNTELFNEMSDSIAVNSFNNATIDLTENTEDNRIWVQLSNVEKKNKLNNSAVEFFKSYMGTKAEGLNNSQVIQKVSEMTGIPLNPEGGNSPEAREQAQRMLLLNYTISSKYTKDVVTAGDIDAIVQKINSMSDEDIIKEVGAMGARIDKDNITKNIDSIRQAFINMKTTDSLTEYLWNKGVVFGLANKGNIDNITVEQFKNILVSDNPLEQLGDLFFGGRSTTKKEQEAMAQYLSDITDSLIGDFSIRLAEDGYQLPLLSPRKAFMAYLKGELSVTDEFIQAFAFKNGINEDYNIIKQIFDDHMPTDIAIDELVSPETIASLRRENKGLVVRELGTNERFLPETYNSYSAVTSRNFPIEQKKLKGKKGKKEIEIKGGLTEEDVIRDILSKYEEAIAKHIKDKTMTVKVAQDLKQQASYALNIAVQDLILSRYGTLLTASDREGLLGMGYGLKLASNSTELQALKQSNAEMMGRFRSRWGELAQKNNQLFSNIEELNKQLMNSGKVYTQKNGMEAIVDVWDELENSINSIPSTAGEFASLKTLTKQSIRGLAPKDAYIMLKVIDLVKNNITRGNFYTQLMYQLNPQLRKAANGLDFFQSFKTVDVGGGVWVPWSLTSNATNGVVELGKSVDNASDIAYKAEITREIYERYIRVGKELSQENLESIVKETLKGTTNEGYAQHYIDAFAPYTSLKGLSNETKTYINQLLNQESAEIQTLLKEAGADLDGILSSTVALDDGSTVAIRDIIDGNVDGWQERLFGGLSKNGQELYANNQAGRNIQEELNGAYAWFNDVAVVDENQSKSITQILGHARRILQRDTHTQKFVDFDNAIGGQNDILKGLMEFHIFGQWKAGRDSKTVNRIVKTWARRTVAALGGYSRGFFDKQLWSDVKKIYEVYYSKSLRELNGIATPNDSAHQVALELAKYFKQLEQRLGSKNGATGVSAIPSVNIAFGNLGNIVRNINNADGVYSLMNKIGSNQVIGLFKFAREGDSSYNKFLHDLATNNQSTKWMSNALDGKSVELIQGERKEIQQKFNEMFGSNFSEGDVNVIIQGLGGYQVVNSQWGKLINKINSYVGSTGRFTRMLMSYPFQLFTVHPQLFAYNVKEDAFKKALGIESLNPIKEIRKKYGVLEGTYVELNPGDEIRKAFDIVSRDSDELKNIDINLDDGMLGLYGKTTAHIEQKYTIPQKVALFDSVRDNANNLIDASQAQTFKGLAFTKALQKNDYITFMNAAAFDEFMQRSDISQSVKDKLLDRVNIYANRIFNNMLGTGFTGLDKTYGRGAISDFFMGVLQTINFKGAWGTNIFRQTMEKLMTLVKVGWNYAKGNREMADAIWKYATNTPEWSNFVEALWGDLVWSWKMSKYSKNGQVPDDESEVEVMDFISWIDENKELVSQQWQGLESFGGMRPFSESIKAIYGTRDKGVESLGYGFGAFFDSLASNFGRGWKPWSLGVDALMVAERDGIGAGWDYLRENFYTLSAGTMRFMIEEGYNAYGANTAITNQRGGIPSFLIGNQYEGSDTAFSYNVRKYQTWDYLKNFFNKDEGSYSRNELLSSAINASQFLKLGTNAVKSAVGLGANLIGAQIPDWAKSRKGVYSLLDIQEDFAKSPTFNAFMETGRALPPDMKKRDKLIDLYTNANYPGGYKAYDGLQNFKNTGHINGNKDKGYYYDEGLEEFYAKINEKSPKEIQNVMNTYALNFLGDANSEEGRRFLYNWAVNWLNQMTDDPDYNKFASALYKGNLNNLYYEILDSEAEKLTNIRKAMGFDSTQAKVSRTDINNIDDVKDRINQRFIDTYYDQMYRADSELMQNQIYSWIAEELEPEVANGYFTQQPEKNYAGNETGEMEWVLSSNIKSQLKDLIEVERAIDEGRWEDVITKTAIMTQSLNYDDEMGLIRASAVDFYANRIMNSNWAPTVKQSALSWLIDNNEDVFKYDSELAEKYGEAYDAAVEYKNEVLYNITLDEINGLNDLAITLHTLGESEKNAKGIASSGVNLTTKLNSLKGALESSPSAGKSRGGSITAKWAAVPIKGLSSMGYKPATLPKKFDFDVIYKSSGYTPKTKTLGPVKSPKKNKAVKSTTRKLTQKEERELDLL